MLHPCASPLQPGPPQPPSAGPTPAPQTFPLASPALRRSFCTMCTLLSVRPASASGRRKSHISDACARGGRPLILTSTPLLPGGWEALITGGEGGRWAGGGSTYVGLSVLASLGAFRELGSLEVCGRMRWGPATKEATKKQEKLDRKDWNFFALKQQMIGSHKHQKKHNRARTRTALHAHRRPGGGTADSRRAPQHRQPNLRAGLLPVAICGRVGLHYA